MVLNVRCKYRVNHRHSHLHVDEFSDLLVYCLTVWVLPHLLGILPHLWVFSHPLGIASSFRYFFTLWILLTLWIFPHPLGHPVGIASPFDYSLTLWILPYHLDIASPFAYCLTLWVIAPHLPSSIYHFWQ